ncbi:MAG: class I SAM-dependent methyltransferase [Flavobacteriales bacterium]|nr:class I SAM-dependent methyltransferase [Flavobacteriales bacterium]
MSHGTSYWPWLKDIPVLNGVHLLGPTTAAATLYGIVRGAEGRMLTDDQVRALPQGKGLWNASEWSLRARSTARLLKVLASQGSGLRILEVGCGNGWLSAALQRNGHHVLGLDPFAAELEQAARVFHDGPTFARGDLLTTNLPPAYFDVVLFPASIQYFPEPSVVIKKAIRHLGPSGTIHVLDSVLYGSSVEAEKARQRSFDHYEAMGFPGMAANYHAHTLDAFLPLGHVQLLARPSGPWHWRSILRTSPSPFTHLVLRAL